MKFVSASSFHRVFFLHLAFLLVVLSAPPSAWPYYPHFTEVDTEIEELGDEWRVVFTVHDTVRGEWITEHGDWHDANLVDLAVSDGVVAWLASDQTGEPLPAYEYRAYFATYDAYLQEWQIGAGPWHNWGIGPLASQEGTVCWTGCEAIIPLQEYEFSTHYSTYDPSRGEWITGSRPPYSVGGGACRSASGIVAWLGIDDHGEILPDPDFQIGYAVYDPLLGEWQQGESDWFDESLSHPEIFEATVYFTGDGTTYYCGYQPDTSSWVYAFKTPPLALFHASPRVDNGIWFTDMSVAGTAWDWSISQNDNRSLFAQFDVCGERYVSLNVDGFYSTDYCFRYVDFACSTWIVPDVSPTIQGAVDMTVNGDTVMVRCGTYTDCTTYVPSPYIEHPCCVYLDKHIVLMSETGDPDCVTIDAQGQGRVIYKGGRLIKGITIANGLVGVDTTLADSCGAGIYGVLTLEDCVIRDNRAVVGAGITGMLCSMSNCILEGNIADLNGGGASLLSLFDRPVIENCEIANNEAGTVGGGIDFLGDSLLIESCIFQDNASQAGGAIHFAPSMFSINPEFRNATFCGNSAANGGSDIHLVGPGEASIEDCVLAFGNGTGAIGADDWDLLQFTISCTDIYGNSGADWDSLSMGAGCISEDPLFCDQEGGDLTLAPNSPCLPENNSCGVLMGALGMGDCVPATTESRDVAAGASFLQGNSPNPFDPQTAISFVLAQGTDIDIQIFDLTGKLVRILWVGWQSSGSHKLVWNGRDDRGRIVPSGTYFCRFVAGAYSETRRMTLVR